MQKTKGTHYEHIEAMSAEFDGVTTQSLAENPMLYMWWQIRVQIAIAQQLSMISAALKKGDE